MSVVSLLGVKVLNNPAKFDDSYEFEITFECLEPLHKGESLPAALQTDVLKSAHRSRVEAGLCRLRHLVEPLPVNPHMS